MQNTKEILNRYNIKLDKNKSQNYLIDKNKLDKILETADIQPDETILEIGAGIGTLTIPMAKKAKKVVAIEKDPLIADILKQQLIQKKQENVEVICADALKIKYPEFDKTVSNLPYQISSPVTFKLLEYNFKKAVLMYQEEFAKRMQAKPDTKQYSRLTVGLYFRCNVKIVDTLKPSAFIPQPKINSAVVELIPKTGIKQPGRQFTDITRALFQHRNKKAKKALINSAHELKTEKKELKNKINTIRNPLLDEKVFKLTPEEILEISEIIEEIL